MQLSKSSVVSILGLIVLLSFIALAYFTNYVFLDKIVVCSSILVMVFFAKLRGESHNANYQKKVSIYTDSNKK